MPIMILYKKYYNNNIYLLLFLIENWNGRNWLLLLEVLGCFSQSGNTFLGK